MSLVFGFNHEEALRSFERAAELDPTAAMPHWGIAWALGPNYNLDIDDPRAKQAFEAIAKAQSLAANGPEPERDYIDALAVRYSPIRRPIARRWRTATARRWRDLSRRYPDDLDAATLYAESLMNLRPWKLWTLDGKPAEDTEQIVRVLESVLARDPNHLGANHYYIHTVEASPTPGRALTSADASRRWRRPPGHLVHMPAHIYARTGDHAAAAKAQLRRSGGRSHLSEDGAARRVLRDGVLLHNLHFLADSHMMQGRLADARQAADDLIATLGPHIADDADGRIDAHR